jgi:hypothetical protein
MVVGTVRILNKLEPFIEQETMFASKYKPLPPTAIVGWADTDPKGNPIAYL